MHSGLTVWALLCWRRGRTGVAFWVAAGIALPFCYNVVFLYPALILALVPQVQRWLKIPEIWSFINSSTERRILAGFALAAGVACLLLAGSYSFNSQKLFWGSSTTSLRWTRGFRYLGLVCEQDVGPGETMPGSLHGASPAVQASVQSGFFMAYGVEVVRSCTPATICGTCLAVRPCVACGVCQHRRLLAVRGLPHEPVPDSGCAARQRRRSRCTREPSFHEGCCLGRHGRGRSMSIPASGDYFRWKWIRHEAPSPQITEVLDELLIRRGRDSQVARNVIIADWHSWRTLDYYLRYHPEGSVAYSGNSRIHRTGTRPAERIVRVGTPD